MAAPDLPAVGRTALGVARVRAAESARPDRLFDDPYAAELVAALGDASAATERDRMNSQPGVWRAALRVHVVLRTRFFDDYLLAAAAHGCRQFVLLGAGMDTRAWRLGWPGATRLFELDFATVLDAKRGVLDPTSRSPRCTRIEVATDLTRGWSKDLLDAGFDLAQPTTWLAEGVVVYLHAETAERLLHRVNDLSAPSSRLGLERADVATAVSRGEKPALDEASALWKGGLGRNPAGWLAEHGWTVREHELRDVAASYARALPATARSGFVTAVR